MKFVFLLLMLMINQCTQAGLLPPFESTFVPNSAEQPYFVPGEEFELAIIPLSAETWPTTPPVYSWSVTYDEKFIRSFQTESNTFRFNVEAVPPPYSINILAVVEGTNPEVYWRSQPPDYNATRLNATPIPTPTPTPTATPTTPTCTPVHPTTCRSAIVYPENFVTVPIPFTIWMARLRPLGLYTIANGTPATLTQLDDNHWLVTDLIPDTEYFLQFLGLDNECYRVTCTWVIKTEPLAADSEGWMIMGESDSLGRIHETEESLRQFMEKSGHHLMIIEEVWKDE